MGTRRTYSNPDPHGANGGESNIAAPMLLRPADPSNKNQCADEVNFNENHIVNLQAINSLFKKFLENHNFKVCKNP
jgi:hypothetical protein